MLGSSWRYAVLMLSATNTLPKMWSVVCSYRAVDDAGRHAFVRSRVDNSASGHEVVAISN